MNTCNRTTAKFYVLVALLAQSNHAPATSIGKFSQSALHGSAERVRVVRKSIGNGTFRGVAAEKPLNRLTQNLAWVITSGTPLSTPNGISIRRDEWSVLFYLFISAARGQTAGQSLTGNTSKHVFLEILHSLVG